MRLCTLHIGLPKAGSSSIQDAMAVNRPRLAANGIYIPAAAEATPTLQHHIVAMQLVGRHLKPAPTSPLGKLATELRRAGYPEHILMSSEFFQAVLRRQAYVERLRDTFGAMGYRVRLIGYLRPQVPFIDLAYSQQSKALQNTLDVEDFIAQALDNPSYDFRRLLAAGADTDGVDIEFRAFNRAVLERGVVQDFLLALGLDAATVATMKLPPPRNVRPGPKTVAACIEIARRLAADAVELDRDARSIASRAVLKLGDRQGWNASSFSGISATQAERIRKRFAGDNDVFSNTVWSKPWNEVFGEDCWCPAPLNMFDRAGANAQELVAFDATVECVWRLLRDGKLDALAAKAGLSGPFSPVVRWVRRLRASSAGWRTRWYIGTSAARRD